MMDEKKIKETIEAFQDQIEWIKAITDAESEGLCEGCTTGKKIVCKQCRIKKRMEKCSLQKKHGTAGRDGNGACLGFGSECDDEPIEQCKRCIACASFDWDEEKRRLSIDGKN